MHLICRTVPSRYRTARSRLEVAESVTKCRYYEREVPWGLAKLSG